MAANYKQECITRLVKKPINWPREMKLIVSLHKECPEPAFWTNLTLGFEINSLAFFKTEDGANVLRSKYLEFQSFIKRLQNK
jgi:hypothetical protein